MKAVVADISTDNLPRKQSSWREHEAIVNLVFALKTYAAAMLALFISFWAALDDPRWAFLTVFVVSQPDSGVVLAKSYYRILGTLAGVIVTIALVFGVSQYGELFLASLAAWIAVCTFASQAARNFAAYGFQLAGYTVVIIGIPAALIRCNCSRSRRCSRSRPASWDKQRAPGSGNRRPRRSSFSAPAFRSFS